MARAQAKCRLMAPSSTRLSKWLTVAIPVALLLLSSCQETHSKYFKFVLKLRILLCVWGGDIVTTTFGPPPTLTFLSWFSVHFPKGQHLYKLVLGPFPAGGGGGPNMLVTSVNLSQVQ